MFRLRRYDAGVAVILLCILTIAAWPRAFFVIQTSGQICYWNGQSVILQWRHSVEKQLWREYYREDQGQLHLYQTEMQAFGAGTPSQGKMVPASHPSFVAFSSNIRLPALHWLISRNMQGHILLNDATWPVAWNVPDYSEVNIYIKQGRFYQLWLERNCNDNTI